MSRLSESALELCKSVIKWRIAVRVEAVFDVGVCLVTMDVVYGGFFIVISVFS